MVPLSRFIGATPTRLAMRRLSRVPSSGSSAMRDLAVFWAIVLKKSVLRAV
jgi:hypothetical protein